MRRPHFDIAAALSLVLFLALIWFWHRYPGPPSVPGSLGLRSFEMHYGLFWDVTEVHGTTGPRLRYERSIFLKVLTTAPFAVLPIRWIISRSTRRGGAAPGICAHCGYDLRATPNRCPECGAGPVNLSV
jgi:hypothetical protein